MANELAVIGGEAGVSLLDTAAGFATKWSPLVLSAVIVGPLAYHGVQAAMEYFSDDEEEDTDEAEYQAILRLERMKIKAKKTAMRGAAKAEVKKEEKKLKKAAKAMKKANKLARKSLVADAEDETLEELLAKVQARMAGGKIPVMQRTAKAARAARAAGE